MAEYIEREALLKGIDEFHHTAHIQSLTRETEEEKILWKGIHSGVNYSRNHIIEAPTADVVEVRHGEWLQTTEPLGWNDVECVECSVCHDSWIMDDDLCLEYYATHWHYCPTCGAKMDRERKPKETVSLVDGHIDNSNKCVSCGAEIPEGTWTCPSCERRWG